MNKRNPLWLTESYSIIKKSSSIVQNHSLTYSSNMDGNKWGYNNTFWTWDCARFVGWIGIWAADGSSCICHLGWSVFVAWFWAVFVAWLRHRTWYYGHRMLDQGLADVAFICSERRNMFVPTTNPVLSRLAIICPFSMCTELSVSHPDHSRGQGMFSSVCISSIHF